MPFPKRLVTLWKEHWLTQQTLAGLNVVQIRRYETDASQPSVAALKKLAKALRTTTDLLLFDQDERGSDDALRLQVEAAQRLEPDEKRILMVLIEGILLQHQHAQAAQRLSQVG
jgi:transcriptional regulator with XRE-family HTH domain